MKQDHDQAHVAVLNVPDSHVSRRSSSQPETVLHVDKRDYDVQVLTANEQHGQHDDRRHEQDGHGQHACAQHGRHDDGRHEVEVARTDHASKHGGRGAAGVQGTRVDPAPAVPDMLTHDDGRQHDDRRQHVSMRGTQ